MYFKAPKRAYLLLLLFTCMVNFTSLAKIYSTGPCYPQVVKNSPIKGASCEWEALENVKMSDDRYTSIYFGGLKKDGDYSSYLWMTNFDFNIPDDAVITGIEVRVERSDEKSVIDGRVQLLLDGSTLPYNKARSQPWLSEARIPYGDIDDLWKSSWYPEKINDKSFGVAISVKKSHGTVKAPRIDNVSIEVYYSKSIDNQEIVLKALEVKNYAQISWKDDELHFYDVLRSSDNKNYQAIKDSIRPVFGGRYNFIDPKPLEGPNYYKVMRRGNENELAYFSPAYLNLKGARTIRIEKTNYLPSANALGILLNSNKEQPAQVTIVDVSGNEVYRSKHVLTEGSNKINLSFNKEFRGLGIITIKIPTESVSKQIFI